MDTIKTRLTNAEYMALPDDGKRYELQNGVLIEMSSAGMLHNWIILILSSTLGALVLEQELGYAATDGLDYILDEGLILKPDVSFIAHVFPPFDQYPTKAPDLAVEVISPSNSAKEMNFKMSMYIKYGSRLVWIIDPDEKLVMVYRPDDANGIIAQVLRGDDVLTGENVIPDFHLPLSKLFNY